MSTPRSAKPQPAANSVLAALPPGTYRALLSGLEPVTLAFGEVLYEPGEPIRDVYFPTGSLVSLDAGGGPPCARGRPGRPRRHGRRCAGARHRRVPGAR